MDRDSFRPARHSTLRGRVGYLRHDAALPTARRREGFRFARDPFARRGPIAADMSLLFAAIGAIVIALVEVTLAPYVAVGDARPHPVLVGGVVWTIAAGIDRGITWAFVGGLVLDSLLGRPLGSSAFAMLVVVGGAALIGLPFPRLRLIAPIVAVPILSVVYSVLIAFLGSASQPGANIGDPVGLFLPGAMYDAILGMFIGPLAITLRDRRAVPERVDW